MAKALAAAKSALGKAAKKAIKDTEAKEAIHNNNNKGTGGGGERHVVLAWCSR